MLGVKYSDAGAAQGEHVIRDLCRHPSTAQFVAAKLVAHFVSDDPPPSAVERIARVFRTTGGDLRAVAAALIELPDAWTGSSRKFRTPQDWLVAVLRAVNAPAVNAMTLPVLRQLRHPLGAAGTEDSGTRCRTGRIDSLSTAPSFAHAAPRCGARLEAAALLDVVDGDAADSLRSLLKDTSIAAGDRVAPRSRDRFQWR